MNTGKNSERMISLWRGEFADNYKEYPRLYKVLTENEIYIIEDLSSLRVFFYVDYEVQKEWIEANFYEQFITTLKLVTGFGFIELNIIVGKDLPF